MAEHVIAGTLINPTFSLKQYIAAQRRFREKCNETIAAVEEDARFYDSPLGLISRAKAYTDIFFDGIVRELMQNFNLYNCTKEDFVGDSSYPQFDAIRHDFDKYAARVKATGDISINIQLEQAAQQAASQITGLGFGLISNSLISHLIYAAQSEATIKKQTENAQSFYNQREQQIQASENKKIEQECRRYYDKITVPRLKVEIHKIYTNALVAYIRILDQVDYIDIEDIQGFDFDRSQQILRNLNAAPNPQNVVAAALSECPYNTEIYMQAIEKHILKKELTELAKDLGIDAELSGVLGTTSDPEADAYIEGQLDRFLSNEIDTFEDNWRIRASTYLRESRLVVQQYPDSFAGYGLVASYLIASNWDNRAGSFWAEASENIEKFFSNYTGDEEYSYHFDSLLSQISNYLCTYFERCEEYIDDNWHNDSEYQTWQIVSSAKKAQIPAINTYLKFISCIEKRFTGEQVWRVKMEKNTLLWHVYVFCLPHLIHRSVDGTAYNLVDMFYHLPLSERDFAIKLYDALIAEGVDEYESGTYSFNKRDSAYRGLKEKIQIYGPGVWRKEISAEGMRYLSSSYSPSQTTGGCYVATAVYGSYNCPQVWTLRRYRDCMLAKTWYGRTFIRIYYAISPMLVKIFGHTNWFKNMWRRKLDLMVAKLKANGIKDTPYEDIEW